jgi:hypothetical protein
VAEEAISVVSKTCNSMQQISTSLSTTTTDSYVYRGKIKSLQDASATAVGHVALLLSDVAAVCQQKADGSADNIKDNAQKLQQVCCSCRSGMCKQHFFGRFLVFMAARLH